MIKRYFFPILISFILWILPLNSFGQCKYWNYSFTPEIKCNYQEYFHLPTRATLICMPRLVSVKSPGDYYQEPGASDFGCINRTADDNSCIQSYLKKILKPEYLCDSLESFFYSFIVFVDTSMENGHNPQHYSFADSSRREFFGKFTIDNNLLFVSGRYNKFAHLYVNIETDSVERAVIAAKNILKINMPSLSEFDKFEYETKRSDVRRADVSSSKQIPTLDIRRDIFYRFIDNDRTINIFKRAIAIMSPDNYQNQEILGTKVYWVVAVSQFFDKDFKPIWAEKSN